MSSASRSPDGKVHLDLLEIPLERDRFLLSLIRHLAGALEDVIGLDAASGLMAVVGQRLGDEIADLYKAELDLSKLDQRLVRAVCIDLKRRIDGDFYVIAEDDEKIVFGNRACPFGDKVIGRPSLCVMTSNVFGTIAAENLGYAKVVLEKTIARGDPGCRIVVYLDRTAAEQVEGREYVRSR